MRRDLMNFLLLYGQCREPSEDKGSLLELEHEPCMHKDGVFPGKGVLPGSCEGVVGIQRIGDSFAHASARAATLAYILSQLDSSGPTTEPPPKPTPKPNTAPPSVPLRARKKELRQIEHRKRLKNRK